MLRLVSFVIVFFQQFDLAEPAFGHLDVPLSQVSGVAHVVVFATVGYVGAGAPWDGHRRELVSRVPLVAVGARVNQPLGLFYLG